MFFNRRGSNQDVPLLLVFMFTLAIVVGAGNEVLSGINDQFQASDMTNESKSIIGEQDARYSQVWDGAFMLVFGLFAVALILSTAALGTRPEFFFITIVVGMFFIIIAGALSNVFGDFFAALTTSGDFTFIPLIMNNLVEAALALIAMLVIGLFVKARGLV